MRAHSVLFLMFRLITTLEAFLNSRLHQETALRPHLTLFWGNLQGPGRNRTDGLFQSSIWTQRQDPPNHSTTNEANTRTSWLSKRVTAATLHPFFNPNPVPTRLRCCSLPAAILPTLPAKKKSLPTEVQA